MTFGLASKADMPKRNPNRYSLLNSAFHNTQSLDWENGLIFCDEGCGEAFWYAPTCDKFISWNDLGTGTAPAIDMEFTADPRVPTGATPAVPANTRWLFGDGLDDPANPVDGATVTHTFPREGVYMVEARTYDAAPGTAGANLIAFQQWPIQVGTPMCGGCWTTQPAMIVAEWTDRGPSIDLEQLKDRARESLDLTLSHGIEDALWKGAFTDGMHGLAAPDMGILNVGAPAQAVSPAAAMAMLEEQMTDDGGTIHASMRLATLWWRDRMLVERDGRLRTPVGDHLVIPGSGYDTAHGPDPYTLPDGTISNVDSVLTNEFQWAIATGQTHVWTGKIEVHAEFDTRTNIGTARAEVPAAAAFETCPQHVGIIVDCGC